MSTNAIRFLSACACRSSSPLGAGVSTSSASRLPGTYPFRPWSCGLEASMPLRAGASPLLRADASTLTGGRIGWVKSSSATYPLHGSTRRESTSIAHRVTD